MKETEIKHLIVLKLNCIEELKRNNEIASELDMNSLFKKQT